MTTVLRIYGGLAFAMAAIYATFSFVVDDLDPNRTALWLIQGGLALLWADVREMKRVDAIQREET